MRWRVTRARRRRRRADVWRDDLVAAAVATGASRRDARAAAVRRGGAFGVVADDGGCACPSAPVRRRGWARSVIGAVGVVAPAGAVSAAATGSVAAAMLVLAAALFAGVWAIVFAALADTRGRRHSRRCRRVRHLADVMFHAGSALDGTAARTPTRDLDLDGAVAAGGALAEEVLRRRGVDPADHARLVGQWHGSPVELVETLAGLPDDVARSDDA